MEQIPTILVVDDDAEIRELIQQLLEKYQYSVLTADGGEAMQTALDKQHVDLILLDIMMPGDDGLALCQKIRGTSNIPVIMVTAMGDAVDRILGLEIGADDYIAKPFHPRELVARIKAVLRRHEDGGNINTKAKPINAAKKQLQFSGWTLDQNNRKLFSSEQVETSLSNAEYNLLTTFLEHPQTVLSRDQIMDYTQGQYDMEHFDRSIDVQVSRLRQRLEKNPKQPEIIKTIRGGGYILDCDVMELTSV